jgi:hypothetical protein
MKIKTRIKRALAAFLREELNEYIGYNHTIPYMSLDNRFKVEHVEFETVVMEHVISINPQRNDDPYIIETLIKRAKDDFANRVLDHIHVDAQNLTTPEDFMKRSIKFTLRVQSKK